MKKFTSLQIILASRPQGRPQPEDFHLEEVAMPVAPPGGVLLRTLYLKREKSWGRCMRH
jgi:NADPH-dependent curcumin reductase